MYSKIGTAVKVSALIIWFCGLICGLIPELQHILVGGYDFNFWGMLLIWGIFFVSGMIYYAFGELIDNIYALRHQTDTQLKEMFKLIEKISDKLGNAE